jgi:hypothetical protein
MARIAGLLHVAEHQGSVSEPISETTMASAIRIGRYFTEHALGAFDEMGADPAVEDARYVLGWIEGLAWPSSPDATPIGAADGSGALRVEGWGVPADR